MGQLRVIGYVRVSKAKEEGISPELQQNAIEDWCGRNGASLIDVVTDLDATGRNFVRAGVQSVISRVEAGEAEVVVVWKWSRFGRNVRDCLINIDRVEVAGARLIAATEEFDESPVGRFGRGQFLLMAQFESERIGEQWKEAKARRVRLGLTPDGGSRYGYTYDKRTKRYTVNPETGPLLAEMYRRYIGGESQVRIVDWLNEQGTPGPRGGAWWQPPLKMILESGFGAGLIVYKGEYHPGAHEPVIDKATWEAYLRASRARRHQAPRNISPSHPFAGLLFCRTCGRAIVRDGQRSLGGLRCGAHGGGKGFTCPDPAWVTIKTVEEAVLEWLAGIADPITAKAEVLASQRDARSATKAEVRRLTRDVTRLDTALARLTRQVAEGLIPPAAYATARDEITSDLAKRAARLQEVQDDLAAMSAPAPKVALDLLRDWPALDDLGKREVLRALVRRITVRPRWRDRGEPRVIVEPVWGRPTPE